MALGRKEGWRRGSSAELSRRLVHSLLRRVAAGQITLRESYSAETATLGRAVTAISPPNGAHELGELSAELVVHDHRFYSMLAKDRSAGLGEAYAQGLWDSPDLVSLFRIAAREIGRADRVRRRLVPFMRPVQRLRMLPLLNTRGGAERNIAAHYDLGNDLFELFLDREAMMYSSAYFEHESVSLEAAQQAKIERVCRGLELRPNDHLLEIGTGWGGLAIHAASNYGCRVTTTTISREQREYAEARVRAAGLEGQITLLDADYRDLEGRFDKLVSIEMIEAVGWEYFDLYFQRCSELLAPHGLFFLQAICIDDRAFEAAKSARTFANQLIFPGGCLPSVETIARRIARDTDMRTIWLEDISPSYALTLAAWRKRLLAASDRLEELGYDERFRRLWEMYFSISEAGFREARIMDVQMLFAKPGWRDRVGGPDSRARPVADSVNTLAPSWSVTAGA